MIIIASYSNVSVTYTADGTQTVFSFPFDYLRKAFVFVEVNEETILTQGTDYSVSNKTVVFTTAPTAGTVLRIFRQTDTSRLVSWADASVLRAKDMTIQQVQELHILEEYQYNNVIAVETANEAKEIAEGISETATEALDNSEEALRVANGIAGTAQEALVAAEGAVLTANGAKETAEGIAGTAQEALDTANEASDTAGDAVATANEAKETAEETAGTAQEALDTAKTKVTKTFFDSLRNFNKVATITFDESYFIQGSTYNTNTDRIILAIVQRGDTAQKLLIVNPITYVIEREYTYTQLGHCNSITYCDVTNKIYIATCAGGDLSPNIAVINANTMQYEETLYLPEPVVNFAYDSVTKTFVSTYALTDTTKFSADFFDLSFNHLKKVWYKKPWSFKHSNGIAAYNGQFVYAVLSYTRGFIDCDFNGNVLSSCTVDRQNSPSVMEIEDNFFINGVLYTALTSDYGFAEIYEAIPGRESGYLDVYAFLSYKKDVDLNDIIVPGIYWVSISSGSGSEAATLHYPSSIKGQAVDGYMFVLSERLSSKPFVVKQMLWRKNDGFAINSGSQEIFVRQWNYIYNAWTDWTRIDASDCLSVYGGTMTGSIASRSPYTIRQVDNNNCITLLGGNDANFSSGAKGIFYGSGSATTPGAFLLQAGNSSEYKQLIGKPDGTLTWGNNDIALKKDYLPLAGGTMTGAMLGSGGTLIAVNKTNSYLQINGGEFTNDGAKIILFGKDEATRSGRFYVDANDGTTPKRFAGYPDGTLMWNGQPIQTSSDRRLKTDFADVPDDILEVWGKVNWKQFKYKADAERKGDSCRFHTGLVAQDVKDVCGDEILKYGILCHDVQEATEEQEAVDLWTVRYEEALAMEAIYQRKRADKLEARLEALEEILQNK